MKDIMLVDNSIISFAFNLENGIPIKAFLGKEPDEELLFMVTYLEEIFAKDDVRTHINETFRLIEFSEKYCRAGVQNKKEEKKLIKEA